MRKAGYFFMVALAMSLMACRSPEDPKARELLRKAKGRYYYVRSHELICPKGEVWSKETRDVARNLYAQYAKGLSGKDRKAVREGRLARNFSKTDVLVILGHPDAVKRASTGMSNQQQWIYNENPLKKPAIVKAKKPAVDEKNKGQAENNRLILIFSNGFLRSWID